jgi:hypothetical protein
MFLFLKYFICILGSSFTIYTLMPDPEGLGSEFPVLVTLIPIVLILSYVCSQYFPRQNIHFKLVGTIILVSMIYISITSLIFIGFFLLYAANNLSQPISWLLGTLLTCHLMRQRKEENLQINVWVMVGAFFTLLGLVCIYWLYNYEIGVMLVGNIIAISASIFSAYFFERIIKIKIKNNFYIIVFLKYFFCIMGSSLVFLTLIAVPLTMEKDAILLLLSMSIILAYICSKYFFIKKIFFSTILFSLIYMGIAYLIFIPKKFYLTYILCPISCVMGTFVTCYLMNRKKEDPLPWYVNIMVDTLFIGVLNLFLMVALGYFMGGTIDYHSKQSHYVVIFFQLIVMLFYFIFLFIKKFFNKRCFLREEQKKNGCFKLYIWLILDIFLISALLLYGLYFSFFLYGPSNKEELDRFWVTSMAFVTVMIPQAFLAIILDKLYGKKWLITLATIVFGVTCVWLIYQGIVILNEGGF